MSDLKTLAESPGRCPYCGQPLQKGKLCGELRPDKLMWIPLTTWKPAYWKVDLDELGGYVVKKRWTRAIDALCCRNCKTLIVSFAQESRP